MATIDIRATITCSLGTLISGSISDDYIQGSGLVKTRGSCELKGILTPAVGTVVTFSYSRGGTTHNVPRKLRVLSSFSDPFRQITKVELGCKLTYFENVTPAPTVDGQAAHTSGRQQQCLNGYIDYPANSVVPIPVNAADVMNLCLSRLGISASSNPLTNRFSVDTFDLSAGYVTVLSNLLQSEGYFGYLDTSEVLQVRDLTLEGGSGPVIAASDVVDLDAIGVGDLPGEAVVVRYNALRLSTSVDTVDQAASDLRNWEYEETVGDPQQVEVRYTDTSGASTSSIFTYIPYSTTTTTYGNDNSWDDTTCVIGSSSEEGADLSNSPVERVTTQRIIKAEAANGYCAQLLSAGFNPYAEEQGTIQRTESYEYDNNGELIKQISRVYEPFFKWAGGLGVDFVYNTANGSEYVSLSNDPVLVEETVVEYDNIYAPVPRFLQLRPGEQYQPVIEGQKVTTTTYQNWAVTLSGQQGSASIREQAPFASAAEVSTWLNSSSQTLVMVDSQVRTQRGRGGVAGQVRTPQALRVGQANGTNAETTAQLIYAMGSASSERFVAFSMPYQSDDTYSANGTIQRGDAAAKALRYGRIQNRLLLGNRNGVNLQLHPSKLPAAPFDPLYLSNGSLMVQYRANALNWAFSSDGIVASVDALYWGVAGGSGTPWVPVAPGVSSFPALPSVVSGNVTVSAVVPPWNEQVTAEGVTKTSATVVDYTYLIGSVGTETVTLTTRTNYTVGTVMAAAAGALTLSGQAAQRIYIRRVVAAAGSLAVTGKSAGNVRSYAIGTNAGSFSLSGKNANLAYQRNPLALGAGSYALTGQAAGYTRGTIMSAAAGSYALTGKAANLLRNRVLTAAAGSLSLTGQTAGLVLPDPYAANVKLLVHADGTNGSTTIVDSSASPLTLTANGSAKLSTSVYKFGTASLDCNSGSNAHISYPSPGNALDVASSQDFTAEFWLYPTSTYATDDNSSTTCIVEFSGTIRYSLHMKTKTSQPWLSFSYGYGTVVVDHQNGLTLNAWQHVAMVRASNVVSLYIGGVKSTGSYSNSSALDNSNFVTFGPRQSGATNKCYMDEIRVTIGTARYTATFTPPTGPFS